jgi:hypothetical protein
VLDFPENRRHLLFLLGRVGQAMDVSPKMARTCWRDLGHHAHGLLVGACVGTGRAPSWWLEESARLDARVPGRNLRRPLAYVTHRVADVLSVDSLRSDWLSEITLAAYTQSGDLK